MIPVEACHPPLIDYSMPGHYLAALGYGLPFPPARHTELARPEGLMIM